MRKASLKILWLLIFSASCFAQTQQSIRDEFFRETDAVKAQADDLDAKVLAPETYAAAIDLYLSANDRMERGRSLDRAHRELEEAKSLFERSIEAANLAQTAFAEALSALSPRGRALRRVDVHGSGSAHAFADWCAATTFTVTMSAGASNGLFSSRQAPGAGR